MERGLIRFVGQEDDGDNHVNAAAPSAGIMPGYSGRQIRRMAIRGF